MPSEKPTPQPAAPEIPQAGGSYTYDADGKLVVVEAPKAPDPAAATYPQPKE